MKKIAIIVTWFGDLPKYFSAWLKSAEHNDSIDFFLFSDQEIVSDKENIIIVKTSMSNEIERYERKLNRKIEINNAYKLCDCRLFLVAAMKTI